MQNGRWRGSRLVAPALLVMSGLSGCAPLDGAEAAEWSEASEYDGGVEELEDKAGASTRYEAENRSAAQGCAKSTKHAGFTGTGFMDFGGNGSWLEWSSIQAPVAGVYELSFRYANGSVGNRSAALLVNGSSAVTVSFGPSGGWPTWRSERVKVRLRQGANTVRVQANTGNGGPNLDHVEVTVEGGGSVTGGQCAVVNEGGTANLSCPSGQTIKSVAFASYGTPTGSCSSFATSSCHAAISKSKVESLCLNKSSCSVGAHNGAFGDPCPGTPKKLAIVYSCAAGGGGDGGSGGGDIFDDCRKNGISGSKHPGSNISFTDTITWSKHLVNNRYKIHVVATNQISDNQMRQACEGLSHMVDGVEPAYRPYMEGLTVMIHADPRNGGPTTGAAAPWFIIDREAFCSTTTPTTGSVTPNTWKTFVHEAAHTIAARIPGCDLANENYFPDPSAEYWAWKSEDWFGVTSQQTRDRLSSGDYNHLRRWYRTTAKWDAPNYCNFND